MQLNSCHVWTQTVSCLSVLLLLPDNGTLSRNILFVCKHKVSCKWQTVNTVQNSTLQYSTVQYNAVLYSTVQYSAVQYSTAQYSTVQRSTVLYSTVQ